MSLILCTCGTTLRVRGLDPLVLEPCPTCLARRVRLVREQIERVLLETYDAPKREPPYDPETMDVALGATAACIERESAQ